jgi:PAS domain S-box-containing protein
MTRLRSVRSRGWHAAMLALGFLGGAWLSRRERRQPPPALEAHSRQIVANAGEAIITVDHHGHIVLATPSAASMFQANSDEMRGQPLTRYLQAPPGATESPAGWFHATGGRAGRRGTDRAATGVRGNGELFPMEGTISTSEYDGKLLHTIILRDVTERQMVQHRLSRSRDQLRQLSAALQTIREEERTYIARELHDDLGQILASLRMDLALLQRADGNTPDSLRLMKGMENNLLTAITSLRRIATNLRPRALDEGGLYFALQGLREDFMERHAIPCALFADESELRLDDAASTAIFRIVQEALTNIARHANASNVTVNLYRLNGDLLVQIRDDGRGIRAEDMEKAESLGLIGMRERVWAMNGEISITSDEPPGTRIDIVVPLAGHEVK